LQATRRLAKVLIPNLASLQFEVEQIIRIQYINATLINFFEEFLLMLFAFKYDIVNRIFTASIYQRCN
jgi:hypothetical protein